MKPDARDGQILQHIIEYCHQINDTIRTFGRREVKFTGNHIYRSAVSMDIMQIGELCKHLSQDCRNEYDEINWKDIAGMRDHFAHGYQSMDWRVIWETAINDIPKLLQSCTKILQEWNLPIPQENEITEDRGIVR